MSFYTLSIDIEANSKPEAEQKLQKLIEGAALPQRTVVGKVVGSILIEVLEHYANRKDSLTPLEKKTIAREYIKNQENKKSTER